MFVFVCVCVCAWGWEVLCVRVCVCVCVKHLNRCKTSTMLLVCQFSPMLSENPYFFLQLNFCRGSKPGITNLDQQSCVIPWEVGLGQSHVPATRCAWMQSSKAGGHLRQFLWSRLCGIYVMHLDAKHHSWWSLTAIPPVSPLWNLRDAPGCITA